MAKNQRQGEFGTWVAVGAIALMLFLLAFMPASAMTAAWEGERALMVAFGGEIFDAWVVVESHQYTSAVGTDLAKYVQEVGTEGAWGMLAPRLYVGYLWMCLVIYRAMALMLWALVCMPFVMAASADGYYVREIRKESFVAQSPVRHKFGAWVVRTTSVLILVWLLVPVATPPFIAPVFMVVLGAGIWIWVGNLQKRL